MSGRPETRYISAIRNRLAAVRARLAAAQRGLIAVQASEGGNTVDNYQKGLRISLHQSEATHLLNALALLGSEHGMTRQAFEEELNKLETCSNSV